MARSLKRIALVVPYGTLLSKLGGLVRQLVIAAAFGVGAAYDAYNDAYVLPGFLLILLGGINGPFHSAMVSVLSRRPKEEGAHILATLKDPKYEHFQPVIEAYINDHFAAALVYKGLMSCVRHCADMVPTTDRQDPIRKCFQSLYHVFRSVQSI